MWDRMRLVREVSPTLGPSFSTRSTCEMASLTRVCGTPRSDGCRVSVSKYRDGIREPKAHSGVWQLVLFVFAEILVSIDRGEWQTNDYTVNCATSGTILTAGQDGSGEQSLHSDTRALVR